MKQTIKLRESELRRMIAESVKRVLREEYLNKNVPIDSLFFLNGDYDVYVDGEILNATIDVENEFFEIGEWSLDGEEAINAITEIYNFYKHSNNTIESAIEQYVYDALR
jgi:hypothetical protein